MPTRPAFTTEFNKVVFGTWEAGLCLYCEKILSHVKDAVDAELSRAREEARVALYLACHKARVLHGHNKLRYDISISHPRGNRGRIDIDLDHITGIKFVAGGDEMVYNMIVQVSSPASCYIGTAVPGPSDDTDRFKKIRAKFEDEQIDFSDGGQIGLSRTHTLVLGRPSWLQKLKKEIEESSHPGLIAALAAGINPTAADSNFNAEEVQASFERNTNNPKKRTVPENENNDTNPASSSRAPTKPRKSNLVHALPSRAGPWLKKCVSRWKLVAPFDPSVTEQQWEEYYKERAALEWFNKEANGHVENEDEDPFAEESYTLAAWTESDFPQPQMYSFNHHGQCFDFNDDIQSQVKSIAEALKKVINQCRQLTDDVENIGDKIASGIYVLFGGTTWEDFDSLTCNDFDIQTRLYSPYGLGTSVDIELKWHCRVRMYTVEHHCNIDLFLRTAADCKHTEPQNDPFDAKNSAKNKITTLFSMYREPSGYYDRNFIGVNKLRAVEETLFGKRHVLSERKMFSLLIHAAMGVVNNGVNKDIDMILRVSRRMWQKFIEENGGSSEEDRDSDNEAKKGRKVRYGSEDSDYYDDNDDDF